jgi:hypothetical protein
MQLLLDIPPLAANVQHAGHTALELGFNTFCEHSSQVPCTRNQSFKHVSINCYKTPDTETKGDYSSWMARNAQACLTVAVQQFTEEILKR